MVEMLRKLGSGVSGTVYVARIGDLECALKLFHKRSDFYRESRVYMKCRKIGSLVCRVPSFKGSLELPPALAQQRHVYRQSICVDIIIGPTLRAIINSLPLIRLQVLQDFLEDTLRIIHEEAGFCHGDVRPDNIILLSEGHETENTTEVRAILLDFSHARFKKDVSPKYWERSKQLDYEMLQRIFSEAKAQLGTETALNFIKTTIVPDACQQAELAGLISAAWPSDSLLAAIQSVESPIPALAVSIARAIQRKGHGEAARAFLDTYTPPELSNPSDQDNRQLLRLECERAYLHARVSDPRSATLYEEVVAKCTEILGATDYYTIHVRFLFAEHLGRSRRKADAITVCLEMLSDLLDLHEKRADDLSPCKGQPVSAPDVEIWRRKLVKSVHRLMKFVDDQRVLDQAQTVLQQITTPCVEQQGTQPTPAKAPKRKFAASSEDLGNRSVMDNGKRIKTKA